MKTTEEYYNSLYKDVQGKWVVLSTFKPDTNVGVLVENLPAEIAARSREADQSLFATFAVFDKRPLTGRGKGPDIGAVVAFFADMDVSDDGHYADNKNPPMTLAELKSAALDWGLPSPSAIVNSGRGYHFEWRLDKPFVITSETERSRATLALKGFNNYVIEKAAAAGIKLDSMGDLARVKRAPGSVNHRPGQSPRPVEVVELEPARTYTIEFMEGFKPSVSRTVKVRPPSARLGLAGIRSLPTTPSSSTVSPTPNLSPTASGSLGLVSRLGAETDANMLMSSRSLTLRAITRGRLMRRSTRH